jgi:uncharacterized membrane protein
VAIDWLRGLVMVIMAVDHSSAAFNAGRLFTDSASEYHPGMPLPTAQFLSRWSSHICAPTFVFLAGTSLALTVSRRSASGESAWSIDKHLLLRGLVIVAFERWFSFFWMGRHGILLQVLYAIGIGFVAMAALRRLSTPALAVLGAAIALLAEKVADVFGWGSETTPVLAMLLLVPGRRGSFVFGYPALPWLAIMLFGWVFGRSLLRAPDPRSTSRRLAAAGLALLALFGVVRGYNGYGNMGLPREGSTLVQWLHVSKYPPSLSYDALELGLMALLLAGFWLVAQRTSASEMGLLVVLGRTPMFFYLLHMPLLTLSARALHLQHGLGLAGTYLFAAAVVAVLYPVCVKYGRYKASNPTSWTRYV